ASVPAAARVCVDTIPPVPLRNTTVSVAAPVVSTATVTGRPGSTGTRSASTTRPGPSTDRGDQPETVSIPDPASIEARIDCPGVRTFESSAAQETHRNGPGPHAPCTNSSIADI